MLRRGFTLVELMIAIVIVGIISIVIYQIFDITSQNFREVDQLAELNDRVRFATENVRNHLQAAANQSTPDSTLDDWVAPPLPSTLRVVGILPYEDWQDDRSMMDGDVALANPNVSFDGVVVLGAFDFPLSFEFAGLANAGGAARTGRIYGHQRGVGKLTRQDLFSNELTESATLTAALRDTLGGAGSNWTARVLRISDRQGYQQFVQPVDLTGPNGVYPDDYFEVEVPEDGENFAPKFKCTGANCPGGAADTSFFGLDDLLEEDVGYDAGLIDAFWFHVIPDEANDKMLVLVRERLCAANVVELGFAGSFDPADHLADECPGGTEEKVILASNVADFQVWFDCADPADGGVRDANWSTGWVPDNHATAGDCMNAAGPAPGFARAAHVRIALHTHSERKEQAHIQFEDLTNGAICDPDDPATCGDFTNATLRTYDFYPKSVGSSAVTVLQSDFELTNFVNRNPL